MFVLFFCIHTNECLRKACFLFDNEYCVEYRKSEFVYRFILWAFGLALQMVWTLNNKSVVKECKPWNSRLG